MPKPSFTKQLDTMTKYYLLPDKSKEEVSKKLNNADFFQAVNLSCNEFAYQCRKNVEFFTKFKELLDKLESDFNGEWSSNSSLNNFFFEYERHV